MRKRNATITVRCTENERQRIYEKARQHDLKLSDYVLRSALGKKIVVANGLDEVIRQMKAIGNILNATAKSAHLKLTFAIKRGSCELYLWILLQRLV